MERRALLLGLCALAAACTARPLPQAPAAPRLSSAYDLIPADLDIVARLDMERMKAALGTLTPEILSRDVLAQGAAREGNEPDQLLVSSLLEADVVYLGYRPSPWLLPLDRVLALDGHFTQLTQAPAGFSGATDLGGDVRYWDRKPGQQLQRSGVARIYALGTRVRAFVSEAELDSVERGLAGGDAPRRLRPPEEGGLSLAVRPALLGRLAGGSLRELLERAKTLEIVIELQSDVAKLALTLTTEGSEQAERLAAAGKPVLTRLLGERAASAELSARDDRVLLTLRVGRAELAPVFACLRAGSASAAGCPW